MVRICRAEDGEVFQTNATIDDIQRSGSLEAFLRKEIGIEEDAALAYLSDGRRLGTDNVSNLAEVHDQIIFVFNKYYLDRDLEEVTKLLHIQLPLQPSIEESQILTPSPWPSELGTALHRAARTHMQSISRIVDSMRHQRSALQLASSVIDFHVLNISDVVTDARQELDKRASLAAGVDAATELASRVQIHREFMSPAVQRAMDAGGPARTLGHYVSGERIRRAVEECRDLQERLSHIDATVKQLVDDATDVRSICADVRPLNTAVALELSSQSLHGRIAQVASALEVPVVDVEPSLQELRSLDESIRDNLSSVVELKNAYTSQCLRAYRQIHTLNAGLVALPDDLTGLQASLDTKGAFSDIERLHNMVYAYCATMVEVVRRKEFSRLFHRKCQGFSEVMSNFPAVETKRRQAFRDNILGQLPFDLIGMDETLPSVEISASEGEGTNEHYTLEKHDISDLLRVLEDSRWGLNDNEAVPMRVQEMRKNLKGLVGNIDTLESGFTDLVEQSLFSSSRQAVSGDPPKRAPKEHSGEKATPNEFNVSEPEMVDLGEQLQAAVNDHERAERLERELYLVRAQLESETTARRALEDRVRHIRSVVEKSRSRDPVDKAEIQRRNAECFRQFFRKEGTGVDKGKGAQTSDGRRPRSAVVEANGRQTQDALEHEHADPADKSDVHRKYAEFFRQLLRNEGTGVDKGKGAQASDGRRPRSAVVEANGGQNQDALEHEHAELPVVTEVVERQLAETTTTAAEDNQDALEHGHAEVPVVTKVVERQLAETATTAPEDKAGADADELQETGALRETHTAHRADSADQLVVQLLEVAAAYRGTSTKALALAQAAVTLPSAEVEDVEGPSAEPAAVDLDLSDPVGAIEVLRSFDHDGFLEAIAKTGSTIRKWQKHCKGYRERSKDKISFRNFAKGDLALFLPTRNSSTRPWAAFNVSFPHYFLQATGDLAEQLKTREWAVARITSILERVVDPNDPESNPFGLGDGVKYYMVQVEDWKQQRPSKRASRPGAAVADAGEDAGVPEE